MIPRTAPDSARAEPRHDLLLGLIGDAIDRSQSPRLHVEAGRQAGLAVRYDRLIPALRGRISRPCSPKWGPRAIAA
jgi:hypothetical protein